MEFCIFFMKMRYLNLLWLVLFLGGCNDYVRQSYDMPEGLPMAQELDSEVIISQLSSYIRSNPDQYLNYLKRAILYFDREDYESALADINIAEQLNPNSGEVLFVKSNIQYQTDNKNALRNALFAEDEGYDLPNLYTLIAKLYVKEGELAKADEYIRHAENIYPYNADVYFAKGMYYAGKRDTITSIINYQRALDLKPEVYEYNDKLIKIYAENDLLDSALNLNEKAYSLFPDKSELVYNKALILERSGRDMEAIRNYKALLDAKPERFDIYDKIGKIYLARGSYTLGIQNYKDWVKAEPDNMEAKLKVAKAYQAQGSYYSARTYVEELLETYPENSDFEKELRQINFYLTRQEAGTSPVRKPAPEEKDKDDIRIFKKSLEIEKIPEKTIITNTGNN